MWCARILVLTFPVVFIIAAADDLLDGIQYEDNILWMLISDDNGHDHLAVLTDIFPYELRDIDLSDNVTLLLYTRSNMESGPYELVVNDTDNLEGSGFNPSHPTKILIHGFSSNGQSSVIVGSKNAYLAKGEYNIIGVDWGALCPSPNYIAACTNAKLVGQYLAELIEFLVQEGGAQLEDFHVIGHSLGGQVAGFTGAAVTIGKIARITGLDTAYPMFGNADDAGRLDPSDAVLVDAIHTCGGSLGFEIPYTLVDFYPNGGLRPQPGCVDDITGGCSHGKSVEYFINSIVNEKAYPAVQCLTLEEAESGNCTGTSTGFMGDAIQYGSPGLYYTDTTK